MLDVEQRWELIDKIAKRTIKFGKYRHTLKDAIAEITVKPLTGIPIAIAVLYGFWAFFVAFAGFFTDGYHPGDRCGKGGNHKTGCPGGICTAGG